MNSKKKVFENSFLYTFSKLLVKGISFLLLPIYTMYLTPEDYGITNLAASFTQVATFIIAMSLHVAIIRFYAELKEDKMRLKRFYGTIITFISISGLVFFIVSMLFKNFIVDLFFDGIPFFPYILLTIVTLTFYTLHTIHGRIIESMQQGKKLTIINLIVFGLQVSINIYLIVVLELGALGILLGSFVVNLGYVIYMMIDLKRRDLIVFCVDLELLKESLSYSIPLMPHHLSTSIATFASRVFINKSITLATVGLYSVAWQFGGLIDIVQSSVHRAFTPWFYNLMNVRNEKNINEIKEFSYILITLYSLMYVIIGLFSQEIIILMTTSKYIMAWTAIPILVMAFSVKSIYYFYVSVLFYYKKASKKIFIATLIGSFADIFLAFILVPILGMYGSAISFLLAKIIVVVIVVKMSIGYDNIGYKLFDMIKIILSSFVFMVVGLYFSYTKFLLVFSWYNLGYKILVLIIYILYIYIKNKSLINEYIKLIILKLQESNRDNKSNS